MFWLGCILCQMGIFRFNKKNLHRFNELPRLVVNRLMPHIMGLKGGTWVTPESPSRPLFSRLRRAATGARKASMASVSQWDVHLWFNQQSWWFVALYDSFLELHLDFWKALLCPFVLSLLHCLVQSLAGPSSLANASESRHSLCAFVACGCWLPKSFLLWRAQMHRVRFVAHLVQAH